MWGPGWWGPPLWGFWWIFPLVGLVIALVFVFAIARAVGSGGQFMCMRGHRTDNDGELAELRREVRELRQELRQLKGDG